MLQAALLEATKACGAVWCGAPNVDRECRVQTHLLLHALPAGSGRACASPLAAPRTADVPAPRLEKSWAHLASSADFSRITRLNNLPCGAESVRQAVCGPRHTALLLDDGRVLRVAVGLIADPDVNARALFVLQQNLERAKREVENQRRKLKAATEELRRLEEKRYPVTEDQAAMFQARRRRRRRRRCRTALLHRLPRNSRALLRSRCVTGLSLSLAVLRRVSCVSSLRSRPPLSFPFRFAARPSRPSPSRSARTFSRATRPAMAACPTPTPCCVPVYS